MQTHVVVLLLGPQQRLEVACKGRSPGRLRHHPGCPRAQGLGPQGQPPHWPSLQSLSRGLGEAACRVGQVTAGA